MDKSRKETWTILAAKFHQTRTGGWRIEELNADLFKNTLGPVKQAWYGVSYLG